MTILNMTEIMVNKEPSMVLFFMALLGFIFALITIGGISATEDHDRGWGWPIGFIVSILACIIGCYGLNKNAEKDDEPTGRYRYEATIDESISAEQLYDKYDVIERRGEIWVLEDKEEMK